MYRSFHCNNVTMSKLYSHPNNRVPTLWNFLRSISEIYQTTYSSCPVYCILLPSRKVPAPWCTIQLRYHQTGSDGSLDVDIISLTSQNRRPFGEILGIPWEPGFLHQSEFISWWNTFKSMLNMMNLKIYLCVNIISSHKDGAGISNPSPFENDTLVIPHN